MTGRENKPENPANGPASFVASDLEGTITRSRVWEGIRDFLTEQGRGADYRRYVRRNGLKILLFRLGLLNRQAFKEAWMRGMLGLCTGFDHRDLAAMGQFIARQNIWPQRRPAVVAELAAHQAAGRRVLIASGYFQPLLDEFLPLLGEVTGIGTPVTMANGRLAGTLAGPMNVGEGKATRLRQVVGEARLVTAYGDSAADIPMLALSAAPVAVFPDKTLRRQAVEQGWRIVEDNEENGR